MQALVHQKKILVLILVKLRQTLTWVCISMVIIVICQLMEKIYKFKINNKNVKFPSPFCLESISNKSE